MKYLNSLTKYLGFLKYGDDVQPTRDWLILLLLSLIIFAGSVGWNIWLFTQLANGESFGPMQKTTNPAAMISVTSVQKVFQDRAAEETNYQNSYHFVDPSVPGS